MLFQKFVTEPEARFMTAIASESGSLLIYDSMNLVWAAQLSKIPVAIQRVILKDLPGGIATLTEEGYLSVGYLGSDPQMFKVPPLKLQELDYHKTQTEIEELEKEIKKNVDITDLSLINATAERDISININVNEHLEKSIYTSYAMNGMDEIPMMVALNITLKFNAAFEQVQITVSTDFPICCSESRYTLHNLEPNSTEKMSCWIYITENYDPISLEGTLTVACINRQNILRVIEKPITLPMSLVWRQMNPQKEAVFKITINLEKVNEISNIFPEFNYESSLQAIGIGSKYSNSVVTIVKAKSTSRFRIQSDSICGLAAILTIVTERMKAQKESRDTNHIKTMPTIPIDVVLKLIDEHYEAHQTVKRTSVSLIR